MPTEELMTISTLDLIKTLWPIVLALIGFGLWLAGIHFRTNQNAKDFGAFREKEYSKDKDGLLMAIREVQESQERGEAKLEKKLEKIATETDRKLDQVREKQETANLLLAEIKGRIYPDPAKQ